MIFYASIEKVSEQKTIVYPNIIMATLVVGNVDVDVDVDDTDYGSTHDEEIVVPLTLMDHNCNSTNTKHPSSIPSWKTKKLMFAGIIGMTAAVASSAMLFLSIMDFPKQESTEPSFLLHQPDGGCVAASGPWPENTPSGARADDDDNIQDDDDNPYSSHPYVTCFSFKGGQDQCWSKSYMDSYRHWQPCKPKGYGAGWEFGKPTNDNDDTSKTPTCGTPCTTFA